MLDTSSKSTLYTGLAAYLLLTAAPLGLRLLHVRVATWLLGALPLLLPLAFVLLVWLLDALGRLLRRRRAERSVARA